MLCVRHKIENEKMWPLRQLQLMLDIFMNFASDTDPKFNYLKSHLFQIGLPSEIVLAKLCLGSNELIWVKELKHLGVIMITSKKLLILM